uniref:Cytochrome P450 89A2 n=2 Tax=Triticum urartu TaxID=4572 RepID=A0A8R7QU96_TRIUA
MQELLILTLMLLLVVMLVLRHASVYTRLAASVKSALARRLRQPAVVIKDRAAAHRLLVRGCTGGSFSNRPPSLVPTSVVSHLRHHNLTSVPYGPFWCVTRRNLTSGVFHPLRLHRYAAARRDALCGLIADLKEQCTSNPDGLVLAAESIRNAMFGLLATMCFGDGVDKGLIRAMADAQLEFVQIFPQLRVFARLPAVARLIHRKRWSKLVALRRKQEEMYLPLIHARRNRPRHSGELPAYVDTLIDLWVPDDHNAYGRNAGKRRRQRRFTDGELVGMCAEFVGAGTETVAAELQWMMANLVKHPQMQAAVRSEIDAAVDADAEEVGEQVLGKLEYLNAVIMEVLRLYPTVTLVVRQVSEEDDVVHDGRRIPAGTNVLFPPESLARDRTAWANPDEFRPERFLACRGGENMNLIAAAGGGGGEIRMMPFGTGRRGCPGMGVAMLHMGYFMANLVKEFEWREAEGGLAVDLRQHFGFFTVMKRPLHAHLVSTQLEGPLRK